MTTWGPMLGDFRAHQLAADRSPGTIRLYRYRLEDLAAITRSPADVTLDLLVAQLGNPAWSRETRKSVRSSYRAFFSWARSTGRLEVDPSVDLPPVPTSKGTPRPAPERVVRQGLRDADPRERLMMLLGAYAGLRASEIARVHAADWDGRRLTVLGKGKKVRRVVILQADLVAQLDTLDGWAFPNRHTGQPITAGHVSVLLSRALAQTYTAHTLRHRYGTVALEGTKDLLAVGEQMGHESTNTTKRYCLVGEDRLVAVAAAGAA